MFQKKTESKYRVTAKKNDSSLSPSDSLTPGVLGRGVLGAGVESHDIHDLPPTLPRILCQHFLAVSSLRQHQYLFARLAGPSKLVFAAPHLRKGNHGTTSDEGSQWYRKLILTPIDLSVTGKSSFRDLGIDGVVLSGHAGDGAL